MEFICSHIKMEKYINKTAYILIEIFFSFLGIFSLETGRNLGAAIGRIIFRLDKKHQNIVIENLSLAFGMDKKEAEKTGLRVFENLCKIPFEMAWSKKLSPNKLFSYFKIEGVENIHNAYKEGRGVLALTAHMGNWELLTVVAAILRHPLSIVIRPLDFKPLDQFMINFRSGFGGKLIPKEKAFRKIFKALSQKHMVALLMDQNVDWYEGVFSPFFGKPACTNKGLALLALKTGAPVVPTFLLRTKSGFFARFMPPVIIENSGDKIKDVETNTDKYNKIIESLICEYKEQWFWAHQRWKTKDRCFYGQAPNQ